MRLRAFVVGLASAVLLLAQQAELERARQLLTSGHAAEAAAIYRELSRADPANANLLLNLAIAEYKAGSFAESAAAAESALKADPNLNAAQLFLGASSLEMGHYDRAMQALQVVAKANPADRNARLMLGQALLRGGHAADAIEHLQAATAMAPNSPAAWYALGRAYETSGRREDASAAWTRLAALPPSLESRMHAAEALESERRWKEAAAQWSECLSLSPQNNDLRTKQAWSLYRARDYEAAMQTLERALKGGNRADVLFLYGASLLNLQRPEQAIPYLERALAQDAGALPARAALGQALLQTGEPAKAIPLLESALGTDEDGSVHFQLFRAYQLTGQKDKARDAFDGYRRLRSSAGAAR